MSFSKILLTTAALLLGSIGIASAQVQQCTVANYTNFLFHPGCLSASDLNNAFSSPPVIGSTKPNAANFTNLNIEGSLSMVGVITTAASTTGSAGLVVNPGAVPVSPPNGAMWMTTSGLFIQVNGGTVGPLGTGGGGGGGGSPGGSPNNIQYNASGSFGGIPISSGQIIVGQSGAPSAETLSGDATLSSTGALLVTKTNSVAFGALATLNTAPVIHGGTGLTVGTLGGIPYFNGTTTMASSAQLTFDGLMFGGGPGAAPGALTSLGLTTQTLHGNPSGIPTWAQVNLSTDVAGLLPISGINATGTMNNTTFLRGDATWAVPAGGGAGGSLTVAGSSGSVSPVTTLTLAGFAISGSTPNATASPFTGVTAKTASYTFGSGDLGNILTFSGSGITFGIPATTTFVANSQIIACNIGSTAVTISSVPSVIGYTPTTIPATQNGIATCLGLTSDGTNAVVTTFNDNAFSVANNLTAQAFTGGFHPTTSAIGTVTTGTTTVDCGNGPFQSLTNGGTFSVAMSANDGSCTVRVTNNGSAGTITLSGFSEGSNTGDALTTTNTSKFDIYLTRIGGASPHYLISALQP